MPELTTPSRAILLRLAPWTDDDDRDLPRSGYGYRPGMSEGELRDSTRAWWVMSAKRGQNYTYAAAVVDGVLRGVWEIDHGSWRSIDGERFGTGTRRRWSFALRPASPEIVRAFVGNAIPDRRADGRRVFGSGGVVAYWPD
jgi:hypothetical protein